MARKKKNSLRDLSRKNPDHDEVKEIFSSLHALSPIAAAILGVGLIEQELETMLRNRFQRNDDETFALLTQQEGPMTSFHQMIILGYAFRLYGTDIRDNLNIVRRIRNYFAHTRRVTDFEHSLVLDEFAKVILPKKPKNSYEYRALLSVKEGGGSGQQKYAILTGALTNMLAKRDLETIRASYKRWRKKAKEAGVDVDKYSI